MLRRVQERAICCTAVVVIIMSPATGGGRERKGGGEPEKAFTKEFSSTFSPTPQRNPSFALPCAWNHWLYSFPPSLSSFLQGRCETMQGLFLLGTQPCLHLAPWSSICIHFEFQQSSRLCTESISVLYSQNTYNILADTAV